MKKIILSAVIMLASVATYAQRAVGTTTVQPKIGVNFANLTDVKGDTKAGLAAGVEFEHQLTDIVSLSGGLLYSMQGAKWNNDVKSDYLEIKGGTLKYNLSYINVPVMANVYVVPGLAVKLGLQPGFCVGKDNTKAKTVDLSIPVGLSYEYNNFVLDGRYNFGVTKVVDKLDAKNSVFQITLGYKFDL
ncbi:hypothetical protein HMPREF1870_01124 [Bacteroidales bacterium KA00344]|nr:hypothetical protein HMPREF1870_01124 [Bacteroidales bacterium KA00344]